MSKRIITPQASTPDNASDNVNVPGPIAQEFEAMFVDAEHWLSDLDFFLYELNFFRKLLDRYLSILIDERRFENTRLLVKSLMQFERKRKELEGEVKEHLVLLTAVIKNPSASENQLAVNSHSKLEMSVAEFVKSFKRLKKEVFALSEEAMESDKAKHLLGS